MPNLFSASAAVVLEISYDLRVYIILFSSLDCNVACIYRCSGSSICLLEALIFVDDDTIVSLISDYMFLWLVAIEFAS